jgi:hypothetical protein
MGGELIRLAENRMECLGRGQNAQWRKTSKWQWGIQNELGNEGSEGQQTYGH